MQATAGPGAVDAFGLAVVALRLRQRNGGQRRAVGLVLQNHAFDRLGISQQRLAANETPLVVMVDVSAAESRQTEAHIGARVVIAQNGSRFDFFTLPFRIEDGEDDLEDDDEDFDEDEDSDEDEEDDEDDEEPETWQVAPPTCCR